MSGARRREKARSAADTARMLARGEPMDRPVSDALESLAEAIDLLADDCEDLENEVNARVRE